MKKFVQFLFLVFGLFLIFYFSTCEVGLGESVDTEPPTVSITYPPVGAIIRDSFILAGKCDDDKELASVNLTIYSITGSGDAEKIEYYSVNDEVELDKANKSWKVEINKITKTGGGYPLKDGEYTFDVIAKDTSSRVSGKSSRSFKIDNTAPLFVIESPGSQEVSTTYGSVLKVSGSIAEQNTVSQMIMSVYKKDSGEKITSIAKDDISIVGKTNVQFARYLEMPNDILSNDYALIYEPEKEKGIDKFFDCDIELSDNAGIYKTPVYNDIEIDSDDVKQLGNRTSVVYLYDSVFGARAQNNVLLGSAAEENVGANLEVSDLMKIKNGTYKGSANVEKVKEILENVAIDTHAVDENNQTKKNLLPITLNNAANPVWSILGYGFNENTSPTAGSVGSSVSFRGECGRDAIPVDPKTFKLWILGPYESEEEILEIAKKANGDDVAYLKDQEKNEWGSHFVEDNPNKVVVCLYDGINGVSSCFATKEISAYVGSTVESHLETIYLPWKGTDEEQKKLPANKNLSPESEDWQSYLLLTGKYYVFHAVGADANGNFICCSDDNFYGFKCTYNEVAPDIITVTPLKELSNLNKDVLSYKCRVAMEGGAINIKNVSYDIKVTDITENVVLGTISSGLILSETKGITINKGAFGSTLDIQFNLDVTTANPSELEWVQPEGTPQKTIEQVINPPDGEFYRYDITLSGMATKLGYANEKSTLDRLAPVVEIQSILTPAKNELVPETQESKSYTNYWVNGEITIQGAVEEANLANVILTVEDKHDNKYEKSLGARAVVNEKVDTTRFTNGDTLKIKLTAIDAAVPSVGSANSGFYQFYDDTTSRYISDQDTDKPVISIQNADFINDESEITAGKNLFNMSSDNILRINFSDDDGLSKENYPIKISLYNWKGKSIDYTPTAQDLISASTYEEYIEGQKTLIVEYELPKTEGIYAVIIEATDIGYDAAASEFKQYHTTTSQPCIVAVDKDKPTISIKNIPLVSVDGSYWAKPDSVTGFDVSGLVSKGIEEVTREVYFGGAKIESLNATIGVTEDDKFTDKIKTSGRDSGDELKVVYSGINQFKQSATGEFSYKVDATPPINDGNVTFEVDNAEYVDRKWYKNSGSLKIAGAVTDSHSGVDSVIVKVTAQDNLYEESTFTPTVTDGVAKYSGNASGFKAGLNTVLITAKDKVGNSGNIRTSIVKVDGVNPVISLDREAHGLEENAKLEILTRGALATGETIVINTKFLDEDSGIKNVKFYVGETDTYEISSSETTYGEITSITEGDTSGQIVLTIKSGTGDWLKSNNTKIGSNPTIYAVITDVAGNNSSKIDIATLSVDTNLPNVAFATNNPVSPITKGLINGKNVVISGTASDDKKLSSVTLYYSVDQKANSDSTKIWNSLKEFTDDCSSWSYSNFNTTSEGEKSINVTDGTPIQFKAVALDNAGNSNEVIYSQTTDAPPLPLKVDQRSDRPILTIMTLADADAWLKSDTLSGTVTDDDGAISSLQFSNDCSTWNTVSVSSGSWSFNTSSMFKDGTNSLFIRIVDKAEKEFISTTGALIDSSEIPCYNYSGSSSEIPATGAISIKKDKTNPKFGEAYFVYNTDKTKFKSDSEFFNSDTDKGNSPFGMRRTVGGNRKYFKVYVLVEDANLKQVTFDIMTDSSTSELTGEEYKKADETKITSPLILTDSGITSDSAKLYFSDIIDISGVTSSGIKNVRFVATDESGNEALLAKMFAVDNEGPSISIVSPTVTEQVMGEVTVNGSLYDETGIDLNSGAVGYLVATNTLKNTTGKPITDSTNELMKAAREAALTQYNSASSVQLWKFVMDGKTVGEKVNPLMPTDESTGNNMADYSEFKSSTQGFYDIPLYIYARDELGNETLSLFTNPNTNEEFKLHYAPDADKPVTEVLYPAEGSNVVSGQIRVSGSAIDNVSVSEVYIQIDVNSDNEFNDTDKEFIKNIYTSWKTDHSEQADIYKIVEFSSITGAILGNNSSGWGLKANGTIGWYKVINIMNELKTGTEDIYELNVRAISFDNNKKLGEWSSPVHIVVNPNAPKIEVPKLVKYSDENCTDKLAEQEYSSGMWLKGKWYLETTVSHDNGMNFINISTSADGSIYGEATSATVLSSTSNEKKIRYKLNTDSGSGELYVKISTADATNGIPAELAINLNYDNTAPEISNLKKNNESFVEGAKLDNRNNVLTIGGTVSDSASGFSRVAFYFRRVNISDSKDRMYDVMLKSEPNKEDSPGRIALTSLDYDEEIHAATSQYLYGKKYTGVTRTEEDTITYNDIADNAHIRVGGIVKIGGTYHKIIEKNGNTVKFAPSCNTEETTAFFAYAQIVDNTNTEKVSSQTTEEFKFENESDDGDGMPETISKAGSTWTWDATVHGNFIPDGPIEFVMFVFDNSENVNAKVVSGSIEQNPPRLAKIYLGTDLNADDSYADFEFEKYDILGKTGLYKDDYDLVTKDHTGKQFVIKRNLAIVPEITGGNGEIKVAFTNEDVPKVNGKNQPVSKSAAKCFVPLTTTAGITSGSIKYRKVDSTKNVNSDGYILSETAGAYIIANDYLGEDGENKSMFFTFWDSSEESTPGVNTQSATLCVTDLTVATNDTVPPNVWIHKFMWESATKNSLYENSLENGHIELEGDLDFDKNPFVEASGLYDKDPKVSGKIVVRGTAYDNVCLDKIYVSFDNVVKDSVSAGFDEGSNYKVVASYDKGEKSWNDNPSNNLDDVGWQFKVYGEYPTEAEALADVNKKYIREYFTSKDIYFGQDGHKVAWELILNTEKVSGVAAADLNIYVKAQDALSVKNTQRITGNTLNESSSLDTEMNRSKYRVDVVPYVTKVTTGLSGLDESFPTAYSRSSLGHYAVRSDEDITIEGFNLTGAVCSDDSSHESNLTKDGEKYKLNIGSLVSGKITVTVNGIKSLNNENNNDAKGSYSKTNDTTVGNKDIYDNYYNRQPNGYNNNRLTDDLVLAVWEFNNKAVIPKSGMALQPIMKINPATGIIGFAYIDGPLWFSMPNRDNSHQLWIGSYDFFTSVGLTYDGYGHSWAVAAGGDINASAADTYSLASSHWGISNTSTGGAIDGKNLIHMDQIGVINNNVSTFLKQRFKSSSLAVSKTSDGANVYLAYYDALTDEVRFKYGEYTNNINRDDFATKNSEYFTNNSGNGLKSTRNSETQAIAKGGLSGRGTGQYVSIGVVPANSTGNSFSTDVVVAVWWDSTARRMRYSYNTTPTTVRAGNTEATGWSTAVNIFTSRQSYAGEYCQIAVDYNGGIHIAAYDSQNLDLVYAYAPKYDGEFETCTVDSSGVVGDKLTIDVALNKDGEAVPYIGYYATSAVRPKYAYKVTAENAPAGAESDKATGNWETIIVPTQSSVNQEANGQHNKINIGVWKDSAGILTNSATGKFNNDTAKGSCWGNGTQNAVLGYAIEDGINGYIETAQMR